MRAMLNAWMQRDPEAPLGIGAASPESRRIPTTDAEMVALAAEVFPEVAVFARQVEGRRDALELARMRWIPDINPAFVFTGSVAQAVGAMIVLPTTVPEIRGRIREAESDLRAAEAMLRGSKAERIGEYIGLLIALRRAEERAGLFRETIEPAARRLMESRTRAYQVGAADFDEVIESRQLLLETRVALARAEATMDKSIAEIECCLGVDLETLGAKQEVPHE
jgi:hypothetical protein